MKNVLLISEPHGDESRNYELEDFRKLSAAFSSRADIRVFESDLSRHKVESQLDKIREQSDSAGDGILVCIFTHGSYDGNTGFAGENSGNFYFAGNGKFASPKKLFSHIAEKLDRPVDVFINACFGGAALQDKDILPKDSLIVSTSNSTSVTPGPFKYAIMDYVSQATDALDAYTLLIGSLATSHSMMHRCNECHPTIGVSGQEGVVSVRDFMSDRFEKSIRLGTIKKIIKKYSREPHRTLKMLKNNSGLPYICFCGGQVLAIEADNLFLGDKHITIPAVKVVSELLAERYHLPEQAGHCRRALTLLRNKLGPTPSASMEIKRK